MIKRKEKKCKNCGEMRYLFGHGMCEPCYRITYSKPIVKTERLNKISDKQRKRNHAYKLLRDTYLRNIPICECTYCSNKATEIHHKAGRVGNNLFKHFLAVCNDCHVRIENNPEWAKEQGYSITRLKDDQDDSS